MTQPLPTIVLCVDDHVVKFFRLWCQALKLTGTACPVLILPFSNRITEIERVADEFGFSVDASVPDDWVQIGRLIYGDEDYRPGLPRAQFFAKLAALSLPLSKVIYYDVNAIPFIKPETVLESVANSDAGILYRWQLSSLGQNIPNSAVMRNLNALNPTIGRGWSANFFICNGKLLDIDEAARFAKTKGLRAQFGTAPEQSFLTHYLAHSKTKIESITKYSGSSKGVSCRSNLWLESEDGPETLYSDDGCADRVKPHLLSGTAT